MTNELKYPGCSDKDIANAEISASAVKAKNHMVIQLKYYKIVVPYAEGIKIMKALKHCEFISDAIAWDYLKIIPIDDDNKISSELISHEEYVELKMRHLLKIQDKPPKESVF